MAIVWLVLKIILWILLGILGLFFLLLILPVTAELNYQANDGFSAFLRVLFLKFRIFPTKENPYENQEETEKVKSKKQHKSFRKKTKAETACDEKSKEVKQDPIKSEEIRAVEPGKPKTEPAPDDKTKSKGQQNKKAKNTAQKNERAFQLLISKAKEIALTAGKAIRMLLSGVWVHGIRVHYPVCAGDAASTAVRTGQIHAAAGAALGVLNNILHLSFKEYRIEPDYTGEQQERAFFSCKITSCLLIMLVVILWAGPKIYKTLKRKI